MPTNPRTPQETHGMQRRSFLAGLLALPFIAPIARIARAVKRKLFPVVYVGAGVAGEGTALTLAEALKQVEPGGTVYVLPGHVETIREPLSFDMRTSIVGIGPKDQRPTFFPIDDDEEGSHG